MYDYGNRQPMPVDLMQHQCEIGLQWLRDDRIDGMIFLASCICDLELETVEWTREWIQTVGDELPLIRTRTYAVKRSKPPPPACGGIEGGVGGASLPRYGQ